MSEMYLNFNFIHIFKHYKMCKMGLSITYCYCCESNTILKEPFVELESECLFVPNGANFQYKIYSDLISLI